MERFRRELSSPPRLSPSLDSVLSPESCATSDVLCNLSAGARLGRLAAVAAEGAGRGELPELVADHVLGHVELDEVAPVVDREGLAHELGHDRAGACPGLDGLAGARVIGPVHLLEQALVDVRALL